MDIYHKSFILLEHRPTQRAIYSLNLTLYLGVNVFTATTLKEVTDYVSNNDVDFLFVDNTAYSQDIAKKCYYTLDSLKKKIQIFILGPTSLNEGLFHIFDKNISLRIILQTIAKFLNVTAKSMADFKLDHYYPIDINQLIPGWFCPRSIFALEHGEFTEVVLPETLITEDFVSQMIHHSVDVLYVKSAERLQFVNSLTLQISSILNDNTLSFDDRNQVTATAHQIVMEQARSLGVSDSTIELANDCIDSMNIIIKDIKELSKVLSFITENTNNYIYKHSLLINFIGSHLIKKMPWSSKEQQQKFSFVCFFHDISLKNDEYAKVHSNEDLKLLDIPEKDTKLIEGHALLSAKIISKFPKIPFGVDTIIKQHHGSKTGEGFNKISADLSPLAIIFILSEEWATIAIKSWSADNTFDKNLIIKELYAKYNSSAFNKIIPYLNDLEL